MLQKVATSKTLQNLDRQGRAKRNNGPYNFVAHMEPLRFEVNFVDTRFDAVYFLQ
jgi:hypothetical protein